MRSEASLLRALLTKVCYEVCVEPELQPVSNPDDFPLPLSTLRSEHVWILQKMGFGVAGQKGALWMCEYLFPFQ